MAEKTVFGLDLIIDDLRGDRGSFRWNWEEVSLEYGLNNNCLLTRIIGIRKLLRLYRNLLIRNAKIVA